MTCFEAGGAQARACAEEVEAEVEALSRQLGALVGRPRATSAALDEVLARWRSAQGEIARSLTAVEAALTIAARRADEAEPPTRSLPRR